MPSVYEQARQVFRTHGGILRTREALAAGIHRRTLYELRDAGELDQLARGALRAYRARRGPQLQKVLEHALVCRVEKVMRPYLEAMACLG